MKAPSPLKFNLFVAFTAISTHMGIILGNEILKYLAAFTQIYIIIISLLIIKKYQKLINWNIALPILVAITLYPVLRIFVSSLSTLQFKMITDGLILKSSYYQLPIVGLAMSVLSLKTNFNIQELLYKYSLFALPIGLFLSYYNFRFEINEGGVGAGYLAFVNCFIPISLLAFVQSPKKHIYLGWVSIFLLYFFSAMQASRSFTLMGVYLSIGAIISLYKTNKKMVYYFLLIGITTYLYGAFSFFSQDSLVQNRSVIDKFQFDSLIETFKSSINEGNLMTLFYWEGNSRADILENAFADFTILDWLSGRGIFSTYKSFVERSTIEMGWAQDTFRWGIVYVVSVILILISGRIYLKKNKFLRNYQTYNILSFIILIRILDGFVYGLPEYSVYNFYVYWGVMLQTLKKIHHLRPVNDTTY